MQSEPSLRLDIQTRLLVDSGLRARFRQDPKQLAFELGLEDLANLDIEQIEIQSALLIRKRLCEVAKLLPRTMVELGVDAQPLFERFAESFWPTGALRHVIDADRFSAHIWSHRRRSLFIEEWLSVRLRLTWRVAVCCRLGEVIVGLWLFRRAHVVRLRLALPRLR